MRAASFMPALLCLVLVPASLAAAPPARVAKNNQAPSVALTAPVNGSSAALGTDVLLAASASDADGSIAKVAFYQGQTLLGTDSTAPYGLSWRPGAAGTYTLKAVATDNARASTTSASVTLYVAASSGGSGGSGSGKRLLGYFAQWGIYERGFLPKNIETIGAAAKLTHITYAFGNVRNNRCEVGVLKALDPATGEGGDAYADYSRTYTAAESVDGTADTWGQPLRGNWNQLKKLKAKYPQLKIIMSLGGWSMSRGFASAARPENRAAFVASCIDAYIKGNLPAFDNAGGAGAAAGVFDGIDIDWEYPAACGVTCGGSEDTDNFTGLLAEFRKQLDAVRPGLLLTVAVGGGIDKIRVTRPDLYHPSVDFINVMTYDFHGAWDAKTNFHSALFNSTNDPSQGDAALYNSNDAIQAFLDRGVPPAKLNLGIAFYGRGWTGVANVNNGLYQSGTPAAGRYEPGIEDYKVLKGLAWARYDDPQSYGHWIFDGKTFWTFDEPATVAQKMSYVKAQSLGGAFFWEFSGDDGNGSLVQAISANLQ